MITSLSSTTLAEDIPGSASSLACKTLSVLRIPEDHFRSGKAIHLTQTSRI